VASFGIAWLCICLLPSSNFVVPAGIILAERTMFLPSMGAMLAIGALAVWIEARLVELRSNDSIRITRIAASLGCAAILVAGCRRSFTRTSVWHDNERLFKQATIDAPQSYRAFYMLGAWMFETHRKIEGEKAYRHALALFPYDPFMSYNLAFQYQLSKMYTPAIPLYRWAFEIAPRFREGEGRENLALCYLYTNDFTDAREQALTGMRFGGAKLRDLRRIVQLSDSLLGRGVYRSLRAKHPVASADGAGRSLPAQSQITASKIATR
jgi:tetratricopeptide (TPR) repeat protein